MRKKTAPFQYLLECSQISLEDFELARLDRAANLRRQLRDIAEEWIDAEVEARLSHWVRENRWLSREETLNPRQSPGALNVKLALLPGSDETGTPDDSSTKRARSRLGRAKHASLARVLPLPVKSSTARRASRGAAPLAVVRNLGTQRNLSVEQIREQSDERETGPDISGELCCRGRGPHSH